MTMHDSSVPLESDNKIEHDGYIVETAFSLIIFLAVSVPTK